MIFGEDTPITLGLAIAFAGAVGWIVWWVASRLRQIETKQTERLQQIATVQSDFALYAAQNYATKDGVKDAIDRVVSAVDGLRQDMVARMGKLEDHWMSNKKERGS